MMLYVYISLAFFAGFAFISGMNLLMADVQKERRRQLAIQAKEEIRLRSAERARAEWKARETQQKAISQMVKYQEASTLLSRWKLFVAQAGVVAISPEALLVLSVTIALFGGAVVTFLTSRLLLGVLVGAIAGCVPFAVVAGKRKARQKKLLAQLPDAYQMIARGLRSGQTVAQAMRSIADEVSSPLAEEFAYCWEQQNLGLTPEASLKELARRTGVLEVKIFVVALTINSSSGGNLSSLLDKLSGVIRDREKMREKIMALTAEGRMQAYMLIAMPFGLALLISAVNPTYLLPLYDYKGVVGGMILWMGVGYVWMQSIINLDQ
jgi:tight adherence protein B